MSIVRRFLARLARPCARDAAEIEALRAATAAQERIIRGLIAAHPATDDAWRTREVAAAEGAFIVARDRLHALGRPL